MHVFVLTGYCVCVCVDVLLCWCLSLMGYCARVCVDVLLCMCLCCVIVLAFVLCVLMG